MTRRAVLLVLLLFAAAPLILLVAGSLAGQWFAPSLIPTAWTVAGWRELLGGPSRLGAAFRTSLLLATSVGAGAAVLGLVIARALVRSTAGWRRIGAAAAFLPVVMPPIALATGLQYAFLRAGVSGSFIGVLLAHLIPATGYASLYLLGVCLAQDRRLEDEARTLGATPWQTLRRVVLPLLRGPMMEAFALGWLVSWSQVPLTLVVGNGTIRSLTVEVLVFAQAGQDRLAATGALLLIAPAMLLLLGARRAGGNASVAPV